MTKIIDAILKGNHVKAEEVFVEKISCTTARALAEKRLQMTKNLKIEQIKEASSILKKKVKWIHTGPYREPFHGSQGPDDSFMTHEYWDLMPEGKAPKNKREGESKFGHIIKGNWHWKKDKDSVISSAGKKKIATDEMFSAFLPRDKQTPRTGSDHLGNFDSLDDAKNAIEQKLDKTKFDIT